MNVQETLKADEEFAPIFEAIRTLMDGRSIAQQIEVAKLVLDNACIDACEFQYGSDLWRDIDASVVYVNRTFNRTHCLACRDMADEHAKYCVEGK